MNTQIKLTYNGITYTLEYNRQAVKALEAVGFNIAEFATKPMTNLDNAFAAAFMKNHPNVDAVTVDNIYAGCRDKMKLADTLLTMINECYDALLADPIDGDKGNVSWEVVDLSPKKKVQE